MKSLKNRIKIYRNPKRGLSEADWIVMLPPNVRLLIFAEDEIQRESLCRNTPLVFQKFLQFEMRPREF